MKEINCIKSMRKSLYFTLTKGSNCFIVLLIVLLLSLVLINKVSTTTINLQTPNTEVLDNVCMGNNTADCEFLTYLLVGFDTSVNYTTALKINITAIPSGQIIDSSYLYLSVRAVAGGCSKLNEMSVYNSSNQTWTEEQIYLMNVNYGYNRIARDSYINKTICQGNSQWTKWNVTKAVSNYYLQSYENATFIIQGSQNATELYSKEYTSNASKAPLLEITYSSAPLSNNTPAVNMATAPASGHIANNSQPLFMGNCTDDDLEMRAYLMINGVAYGVNSSVPNSTNFNISANASLTGENWWNFSCSDGLNSAEGTARNITIWSAPLTDTCTYGGTGDWVITHDCLLTTEINLGGNVLTLKCPNKISLNTRIYNIGNVIRDSCNVICGLANGCFNH